MLGLCPGFLHQLQGHAMWPRNVYNSGEMGTEEVLAPFDLHVQEFERLMAALLLCSEGAKCGQVE